MPTSDRPRLLSRHIELVEVASWRGHIMIQTQTGANQFLSGKLDVELSEGRYLQLNWVNLAPGHEPVVFAELQQLVLDLVLHAENSGPAHGWLKLLPQVSLYTSGLGLQRQPERVAAITSYFAQRC